MKMIFPNIRMRQNGIKLSFGINEHKKLVHISDVESGRKCNCICPACSSKLVAVKGKQKQNHFRHDHSHECENGLESAIHLAAKQVIIELKEIVLPEYIARVSERDSKGKEHIEKKEIIGANTIINFDSVNDEVSLYDMRADIVAMKRDQPLIIEIFYRHKVDEEKLLKIRSNNISAIEIDLSDLKPEDVRDWKAFCLCISDPNRIKWLHNSKAHTYIDKLKKQLVCKIKIAEEKYTQEDIKKTKVEKKEIEEFLAALNDFKRICSDEYKDNLIKEADAHPFWKNKSKWNKLSLDNLPPFLNFDVPNGNWIFGCDRRIWQPAFYLSFIELNVKAFSTKRVCVWLNSQGYDTPKCIMVALKFRKKYPQLANEAGLHDLPSAWRTLNEYFWHLHSLGVLEYTGDDYKNPGNYWFKPI